jgi:Glycosyl hydrolase family 26
MQRFSFLRGRVSPRSLFVVAILGVSLLLSSCLPAASGAGPSAGLTAARVPAGSSGVGQGLGFYPGYAAVSTLTGLESWLGRQVGYVVQFSDGSSSQFTGSIWGQVVKAGAFQTLANRITLVESVPLAFDGGFIDASSAQGQATARAALQATVDGAHDGEYRLAAQYLRDGGFGDSIIRLGWEFDGGWYAWSSNGNCSLWQSAWRHVHDVLRSVSPDFRFDWNATASYMPTQAACAWPGDNYVDVVGLDYYDKGFSATIDPATGTWVDPTGVFNSQVLPHLRYQRDFAIAHGKQVSYPEWALATGGSEGRGGGDNPAFIQGMYDWMTSLPGAGPGSLAYQAYFNEDAPQDGNHRLDNFPKAKARYRATFGNV